MTIVRRAAVAGATLTLLAGALTGCGEDDAAPATSSSDPAPTTAPSPGGDLGDALLTDEERGQLDDAFDQMGPDGLADALAAGLSAGLAGVEGHEVRDGVLVVEMSTDSSNSTTDCLVATMARGGITDDELPIRFAYTDTSVDCD